MKKKLVSFSKGFAVTAAVLVISSVLLPRPAKALFGEEIPILLEQLSQLQMQYRALSQQLAIAKQNVLALTHKETYTNLAHRLLSPGGGLSSVAYAGATVPVSADSMDHSAVDYNYVTMSDDTAQKVISMGAEITRWQNDNQRSASQWENAVYSPAEINNTPVALQSLTNIGLVNLYHQGQAQLALTGLLTEQVALQNIKDRNERAERMKFFADISKYDATEGGAWIGAAEFLNTH